METINTQNLHRSIRKWNLKKKLRLWTRKKWFFKSSRSIIMTKKLTHNICVDRFKHRTKCVCTFLKWKKWKREKWTLENENERTKMQRKTIVSHRAIILVAVCKLLRLFFSFFPPILLFRRSRHCRHCYIGKINAYTAIDFSFRKQLITKKIKKIQRKERKKRKQHKRHFNKSGEIRN